ncbi:hypothetical protein Ptr86124_002402 [Pyrenophora tritici-repentis]|uniref:Uncharacterized protein n=1 Tax=Pyrenophora tritici-repentis TaxID=45151 RepID=A0A922NK04_9PLEO|nr:hypothetical protein Ptr86124_002402 [Pyrenophora tritici-repentis]
MDKSLHQHARRGGGTKHANFALTARQKLVKQIRAMILDMCGIHGGRTCQSGVHVSPLSDNDVLRSRCWGALWEFGLEHHGQLRLAIGTTAPGLPSGEAEGRRVRGDTVPPLYDL